MANRLGPIVMTLAVLGSHALTSRGVISHVTFLRHRPDPLQRLYVSDVLWDADVTGLRQCAVLCATDAGCAAFVLARVAGTLGFGAVSPGGAGLCRAYVVPAGALSQRAGGFSVVPEAVLYELAGRSALEDSPVDAGAATSRTSEATTEERPSSAASTSMVVTSSATSPSVASSTTTVASTVTTTVSAAAAAATTATDVSLSTVSVANTSWLYSACTTDTACTQLQVNATCISNNCVCDPGLFYSVSTTACLADCSTDNLQRTFTRYARIAFQAANPDREFFISTVDECLDLCLNNNGIICRSASFSALLKICSMSFSVGTSYPALFLTGVIYEYQQRQCE